MGTMQGQVKLIDPETHKMILDFKQHESRIATISLANNKLLTGSRDNKIKLFDLRSGKKHVKQYLCHDQEVVGLKWSFDSEYFSSGGNDNRFFVHSLKTDFPIIKKTH
jgi:cell division cycle 20-like protein 1 (cofactor of APC complex)